MFPRASYLARSAGALPGARRGAGAGSPPGPPAGGCPMKLLNHRPAAFTFFCTAWCETTSYTSLLALGNDTFTLFCECPAAS